MDDWKLPVNKKTGQQLFSAYSESHRHYHTLDHITACLEHLNKVKHLTNKPAEIAMALWFHDAVYKPLSKRNERQSALWAERFLKKNNIDEACISRVCSMIMATQHHAKNSSVDESIMVDIDLSILGASSDHYDKFEHNIRKEYKRVPLILYTTKRKQLLQGFLDRAYIYNTGYFRDHFEHQARENISNALLRF